MKKIVFATVMIAALSPALARSQEPTNGVATSAVKIMQVQPTPLFPKPVVGQVLKQLAHLQVNNPGPAFDGTVRVTAGNAAPENQAVKVGKGKTEVDFLVPDMTTPTPVTVELLGKNANVLAAEKQEWQPQKKWTILLTSYSHQDLGFGDYPHRLRTTVRHANINWPLKYCTETDSWPKTEQFRWNIESSEPLGSYISFYGKQKARELAQRIREGRIEISQAHATVDTEHMNEELLARLFYNAGRLMPDALHVPRNKTIQMTDVVGFSASFPTYATAAGCENLFHGYNFGTQGERWTNGFVTDTMAQYELGLGKSVYAPAREPACYFQGSDGQKLFALAVGYSAWGLQWDFDNRFDNSMVTPVRMEHVMRGLLKQGWPSNFDIMLFQEATDFNLATRRGSTRAHDWNQRYAWPKIETVTLDQYFERIAKEVKRNEAKGVVYKTFTGDNNNQWTDQKSAQASLYAHALRVNAAVPSTEKLATIAQALAGGIDGHADLQNAYSRLLQYHEHTDGPGGANMGDVEGARYYETELAEHREQVAEADRLQADVRGDAQARLNRLITRTAENNLVVFNPIATPRTEVFKSKDIMLPKGARLVDAATGEAVVWQRLPEGEIAFVAKDIPATGYRVYRIEAGGEKTEVQAAAPGTTMIENEFYRISVDPKTGVVTSLFDKGLKQELVEQKAPDGFNEYLYMNARPTNYPHPTAIWTGKARMTQADEVVCAHGPLADVVTISGKATGVNALRQTIILYHGIKKVDFSLWMDKAPEIGPREAVFVSLPLNVPDFSIHHGVPGAVIEPYREQIEGSSTAHYGTQRFTDLSNKDFGVTISREDNGLVCYGEPQPSGDHNYNRSLNYPKNSRVYLYMMNNMFSVNIARDQRGPCSLHWSLMSHAGDWKAGGAAQFGAGAGQPFVAWRADGANAGTLPAVSSFLAVDAPNVICTTVKPAESNGRGVILRFSENSGVATRTRVSAPFMGRISSVTETSLVEDDRDTKLPVTGKNSFTVSLRPFGVTTVRVVCDHAVLAAPSSVVAQAVADMQVNLHWAAGGKDAAHYTLYRDTDPNCPVEPLNFVGQTAVPSFSDLPRTHPGGLRSTLEPGTTYYYRVVPVDRWNNPGSPSEPVKVVTLSPTETGSTLRHGSGQAGSPQANLPPVKIQGLVPILVSPRSAFGFINVMFHTAAESDVASYEIHRSTRSGFTAGEGTLVGQVKSDDIIKGWDGYGHINKDYPVKEFDHVTFLDKTVEPGTEYYYKVRAVDAAGQKGACSGEGSIRTKGPDLRGVKVTAQSTAEPRFSPAMALDGVANPYFGWISAQYGGGTKVAPKDVWWSVEFPKAVTIRGVKISGDNRDIIPIQKNLLIQVQESGEWRTVADVKDAVSKDVSVSFAQPVTTKTLRVFVPAADLPKSANADVDGWVRLCEVTFINVDGKEISACELVK